jgi:signal peptidase I
MRRAGWVQVALCAYPRRWRERYEREVLDLGHELRLERGVGERRIAAGLLLNAPRAWFLETRRWRRHHALTGAFLASAATAAVLAALLVPAGPASSSPIKVVSGAMEPALKLNEVVQVTKLPTSTRLAPGEIVVIENPPTQICGGAAAKYLVKRIIGLPGQTISLERGDVLINGQKLTEPWLAFSEQGTTTPGPPGTPYSLDHSYRIPPRDYYVLGDNRTDSCDSRYFGPISRSLVYGVVDPSH